MSFFPFFFNENMFNLHSIPNMHREEIAATVCISKCEV